MQHSPISHRLRSRDANYESSDMLHGDKDNPESNSTEMEKQSEVRMTGENDDDIFLDNIDGADTREVTDNVIDAVGKANKSENYNKGVDGKEKVVHKNDGQDVVDGDDTIEIKEKNERPSDEEINRFVKLMREEFEEKLVAERKKVEDGEKRFDKKLDIMGRLADQLLEVMDNENDREIKWFQNNFNEIKKVLVA